MTDAGLGRSRARGYPVNLVVAGRRCVVVGAGRVAARKIKGLLDAGARVHVVAPQLDDEVRALVDAGAVTVD
jgi:precorrin-2 dehydrogenase/sirohydrochlorin ferrochelatase